MLHLVGNSLLALLLVFPSVSVACGFRQTTPEMVAENRAQELQLAKLTSKQSEFVFVGEVASIIARSDAAINSDIEFNVVEPLVGKPGGTVLAHWAKLGSLPVSCNESGWFNIPRRIVEGSTYVVYLAAGGRLLRAAPIEGRSELNLPTEDEKTILIASGT